MVIPSKRVRLSPRPVVLVLGACVALATTAAHTGCAHKSFKEADVEGTYAKTGGVAAVVFTTSNTGVSLKGTEGEALMALFPGGHALLFPEGGAKAIPMWMSWFVKDGRVAVCMPMQDNLCASGQFKGDRIVGLGGKGLTWERRGPARIGVSPSEPRAPAPSR